MDERLEAAEALAALIEKALSTRSYSGLYVSLERREAVEALRRFRATEEVARRR